MTGTDEVAKISYRTGRVVREKAVGDHPQRVRNGFVHRSLLAGLPAPADLPPYEPMPPYLPGPA